MEHIGHLLLRPSTGSRIRHGEGGGNAVRREEQVAIGGPEGLVKIDGEGRVTLHHGRDVGTQLSWGPVANAAEYRIYRGDLGCDRQQVALADLPSGQTSYLDDVADPDLPRFYRVEAIGSNAACHGPVSNCEATPLTARLQQHAHRMVELGPDAPNGIAEPGETLSLPLALFNSGLEASSGTAVLVP